MGLFDRSSSKSTNTTNNLTENYTDTYNTAMAGGDSEIGENALVLQHSSLSTVDNSLAVSMADNSMRDSSTRTANSNNVDRSDNSFTNSMTDNSNRSSKYSDSSNRSFNDSSSADNSFTSSMTDNSNRSTNSSASDSSNRSYNDSSTSDYSVDTNMTDSSNRSTTINSTDGGSFGMVSDIMKNVIGAFSTSNSKMLDFVGLNQKEAYGSTNALVGRSLDSAMAVKSGSVISEPVNSGTKLLIDSGVKVAAVAAIGFAAYKIFGGRK